MIGGFEGTKRPHLPSHEIEATRSAVPGIQDWEDTAVAVPLQLRACLREGGIRAESVSGTQDATLGRFVIESHSDPSGDVLWRASVA